MNRSLAEMIATGDFFQGYAYAYPHKTAYRRLEPPRALREIWAGEDTSSLFLYAHVPFCEMRCGFCNLFTTTHPGSGRVTNYLDALERQADAVAIALGSAARFSRLAIGGGTPTFLTTSELARLFAILNDHFIHQKTAMPKAVEASPATVDEEKITCLRDHGITRASLGVQSFLDAEVRALGRAQDRREVRRTLAMLTAAKFSCVNIDLIYGIAGQTPESWERSLSEALEFAPQEIYLYPLYVRPLTHLGKAGGAAGDGRMDLYRAGRDFLLERGYRQISMRLFRHSSYAPLEGPVYCCQEDGMVGLGAGARAYTTALHYSSEYAVGRPGVLNILADYTARTCQQFSQADYGCELDLEEQKRRYLLKSLLRADGLEYAAYRSFFGTPALEDFPQLAELAEAGLILSADEYLRLNARGLELSDVIGPWLWSATMREKMDGFVLT